MNTKLFRGLMLGLVLLTLLAAPALAEGPGTGGRRVMLDDEAAGPYLIRVVTSPTPPRVENLYVEVRVLDAETLNPVTDATVWARAEPTEDQAQVVQSQASHDIAPIPTEFAAHLPVEASGVWRVVITINEQHQVSFLTRVGGSTAVSTVLAIGLPVAGLGVLIGVFLYLQRQENEAE
jgi:hypothetical protein